jgi:hypothetical protein
MPMYPKNQFKTKWEVNTDSSRTLTLPMLPTHLGHNVCSHIILSLLGWWWLIAQLPSSAQFFFQKKLF